MSVAVSESLDVAGLLEVSDESSGKRSIDIEGGGHGGNGDKSHGLDLLGDRVELALLNENLSSGLSLSLSGGPFLKVSLAVLTFFPPFLEELAALEIASLLFFCTALG